MLENRCRCSPAVSSLNHVSLSWFLLGQNSWQVRGSIFQPSVLNHQQVYTMSWFVFFWGETHWIAIFRLHCFFLPGSYCHFGFIILKNMQKSFKTTGTLKMGYTPETNIEPANHPFEKENHLPNFHFGVPCWFSGVYWKQKSPNLEISNFLGSISSNLWRWRRGKPVESHKSNRVPSVLGISICRMIWGLPKPCNYG